MKLKFKWMTVLVALLTMSVNSFAYDDTQNENILVFDNDGEVIATYHVNDFTTEVGNPAGDSYGIESITFPDTTGATANLSLPGTAAVVPNVLNNAYPKSSGSYPKVSFYGFDDAENTAFSSGRPVVTCDPESGTFSQTTAVSVSLHSSTSARYSTDGRATWIPLSGNAEIYIYKTTNLIVEATNAAGTTEVIHDYTIESPENADTDGDGYPDCWEILYGLNPLSSDISKDTDRDGISDIDEILRGSDPLVAGGLTDTDGDGWSDADELLRGTDPGNPADTPVATSLYEVEQILSGRFFLDNGRTETAGDILFDVTALDSVSLLSGYADGVGVYDNLRLPAGEPLLLRGSGDGGVVHENFIVKRYVPFIENLTPGSMPADQISEADWAAIYADPSEWTTRYMDFLSDNLVVLRTDFDLTPESIQAPAFLERELELLSGMGNGRFILTGTLSNAAPSDSISDLKGMLAARGQDMNDHFKEIQIILDQAETCISLKTDLDAIYPATDGTDTKTTERKTAELLQQETGQYLAGLLLSDTYESLATRADDYGISLCLLLDPAGDADGDGADNSDEISDPSGASDMFDTDSDDDGILDGIDNCPSTPNPDQLDYDADGLGDVCDDDIDNDGLDNGTEQIFGSSSYTWDTDEDGTSDSDEWLAYEDVVKPGNSRPLQPSVISPSDGELDVASGLVITGSTFADPDMPDGDYHGTTTWQIALDSSFSDLVYVREGDAWLTSLPVNDLVLTEGTLFYVRVKYADRYAKESLWSETSTFTTLDMGDDAGGNGIPDDQDVDDTVDLDDDDTPDIDQPEEIKCVNTVVNNGIQICVKRNTNVSFIHGVLSVDPADIDATLNRPAELPAGLIRMRLEMETVGAEASVTVYFSRDLIPDTLWFRHDDDTGWEDFSAHAVAGVEPDTMIVTLKDGGFGDSDGVENGIIVTTGGIDTALAGGDNPDDGIPDKTGSSGGGSSGGGCFIQGAVR